MAKGANCGTSSTQGPAGPFVDPQASIDGLNHTATAGKWMRRGVTQIGPPQPLPASRAESATLVGAASHDARKATGSGALPVPTAISAAVTGTTRPP